MKKLLRLIVLLVVLIFGSSAELFAQRECASHEIYQQMAASDPQFVINQQKLEAFTQQFIANGGAAAVPVIHSGTVVYRIPVVFHILYNTSQPATNISDERVLAQLKVLNEDFQKLNTDWLKTPSVYQGRVADVQIEFCLPQRDPSGNPTSGIIRKQTSVTSFSSNNAMKYDAQGGSNAWPRDSYLNFWVCNLGSSLLGYAQFPGGAAATDGVVCHYGSVGSTEVPGEFGAGSYGIGRTATHEIGHWLNLRHIWGDTRCGNDGVGDTPVHPSSNGGCPSATLTTSCNPNRGDLMMWMNYMDYTYDRCMYMFTEGQKDRMWTVFQPGGFRYSITQSSAGCQGEPGGSGCAVPGSLSSSGITQTGASLSWGTVSGAQSYTVQYRTPVGSGDWTQTNAATNSISLTGLTAASTYEWQVRTNCSGSSSAFSSSAQFTTQQPAITCSPASGLSVSNVTLSGATLSWTNGAEATSARLEYRINNTATWTVVNPAISPYNLGGLAASTTYNWRVQSNCSGATSTFTNGANFTTLADPNACTDAYEPNDNSAEASSIPVGQAIQARICTAADADWFTFSNNNQNRSVRVTLTVPAGVNYNFRLYRPNGQLAGNTLEQTGNVKTLTYAGNPTGAYRVEVFSSLGSSATAYTLLAEIGSNFREDAGRMIVLDKAVNMFPNPASNELLLQFGNEWRGKADVIMTDIQGRRVQHNVVNAVGTVSVNVGALQMGLYLVQVTNSELTQTQKIMIKR
jgi:hypothetical protein